MEQKTVTVDTSVLMAHYRQLLTQAESLPLRVSGNSMAPFLVHGRDTVWLTALKDQPKVGDVVLYQRDSGSYILHRICRKNGNCFTIAGDAHWVLETGIRRDQMFARVCQVERNGKILTPGCFWWEFFAKVWPRIIPLRKPILRVTASIRKWIRRK